MAQELIRHNVLSLDFWQDTVTYAGSVMPTGTIGCVVLNIPDETIAQSNAPCMTLNLLRPASGQRMWIGSFFRKRRRRDRPSFMRCMMSNRSPAWTESSLKIISCRRFPRKHLPS